MCTHSPLPAKISPFISIEMRVLHFHSILLLELLPPLMWAGKHRSNYEAFELASVFWNLLIATHTHTVAIQIKTHLEMWTWSPSLVHCLNPVWCKTCKWGVCVCARVRACVQYCFKQEMIYNNLRFTAQGLPTSYNFVSFLKLSTLSRGN